MDINSLLSPQDSPANETPSPVQNSPLHSPGKRPLRQPPPRRTSSTLSQQVTSSAQYQQEQYISHAVPQNVQYHQQIGVGTPLHSPGITSAPSQNGRHIHSATSTPDPRSPMPPMSHPPMHRNTSTPQMDTLADLASMQQQQQAARDNAGGLRDPQIYQTQRPPMSLQNLPRSLSGNSVLSVNSVNDITMAEPALPEPRVFVTHALSEEDCVALTELAQTLSQNSYEYESHVRFVTLLHHGFIEHMQTGNEPQTYELLSDLRQAYRAMDNIYPVGESLWVFWIEDEKTLCRNIEDKISIIELLTKATQDEPYSSTLWRMYGDFIYTGFACVYDIDAPEHWSEDEKLIGKEIFTWEQLLSVWNRAVAATQHRMNDSNVVWDRYMEILMDDYRRFPSPDKLRNIEGLLTDRLLRPHASWAETFQLFSSFISTHKNETYEETMDDIIQRASNAKQQYNLREDFEFKLMKAVQNDDKVAEWYAFTEYLNWEKYTQGIFSFHLIDALFERATLRFPTADSLWEDHAEFLIKNSDPSVNLLHFLERATRHCPWSGNLWSHRILALEAEKKNFKEIERVKHSATETGLLDYKGLEDLLKVYSAWCGYLRRRAFEPFSSEDDADIAEVGIRSALEHVKEIGIKKYGDKYQGDPQYRLERIHIKFFTQGGAVEEARKLWITLIPQQQDSYDFWYRYYIWEMIMWSNHAIQDPKNAGVPLQTPQRATAILSQGLKRCYHMDYPEQLIQMYQGHCEQHESVQILQNALIDVRKKTLLVEKRRAKEAAAAAAQYQQAAQESVDAAMTDAPQDGKRKREVSPELTDVTDKKIRTGDMTASLEDKAESVTSNPEKPQRDREHTTIIVKKLPLSTTQTKLRRFFTDCGKVQGIILQEWEDDMIAVIEFERFNDVGFALFKSKTFEGVPIEITMGTDTTLFVTNYPPEADEAYIRNLFKNFGPILDTRFPSLKVNTHRRFCYVQFPSAEAAEAATSLDGTDVQGLALSVKISRPHAKKSRDGATAEGREVYVTKLSHSANETDVNELFAKFGDIERIKLLKLKSGKNKGFCYVVYKTKEQAEAAVSEMDGKQYHGLQIHVRISTLPATKYTSSIIEPSEVGINGEATKRIVPESQVHRVIALMNVPDTVNDARIRVLAEPYGELKRITLMPQHQGAIVEYVHGVDAGKAGLGLDGYEIAPGRLITIGTPREMKQMHAEHKEKSQFVAAKKAKETEKKTAPGVPAFLRKHGPVHPMGRGAKRGGLGFKGRGGFRGGSGDSGLSARSNDDFKNMFLKSKEDADAAKAAKEAETAAKEATVDQASTEEIKKED